LSQGYRPSKSFHLKDFLSEEENKFYEEQRTTDGKNMQKNYLDKFTKEKQRILLSRAFQCYPI
jgi:dGTP triphosphohydrolase